MRRLARLSEFARLAGFALVLGVVAATWLYLPSFAFSAGTTLPGHPVKPVGTNRCTGQDRLGADRSIMR